MRHGSRLQTERELGVCFELLDLIMEHLLHFTLGHVDHGHLHVNFGGHLGDRKTLDGRQAERLPGVRRYAQAHLYLGRFQQFVIEGFGQLPYQIFARLDRFKQLPDGLARARPNAPLAVYEIPPCVMRNRLEPPTKAAPWIVGEVAELSGQFQQDLLSHVLGVGVLQSPMSTPAVNMAAVVLNELVPSGFIRRIVSKPR
jgi:hypothetical protein